MKKVLNKQSIGFLIGIAVGLIVYLAPLSGINEKAQMDLALSLMTVVWWAFQIAQPAYIGGIYLMLLILTNVATPTQVFAGSWTKSIMWLVMGAYLIAGAVRESGLCFHYQICSQLDRYYRLNLCLNLHPCFTDSASLAPCLLDHVRDGCGGNQRQNATTGSG